MKTISCTELRIWVTDNFEGYHRWPNAPDCVSFLRQPHRHIFHVKAEFKVQHADRYLEFIKVKRELHYSCAQLRVAMSMFGPDNCATYSCEQLATSIAQDLARVGLHVCSISVSEDNENGATLTFSQRSHPSHKESHAIPE